ncbi:MAG: sigma 54-interacting transcriptional regulator [Candidatus Adiutrix intracellularis]|nr:sigma 54-interacting transcriptional regulator [Candidatus Adiutrix intracellularis]
MESKLFNYELGSFIKAAPRIHPNHLKADGNRMIFLNKMNHSNLNTQSKILKTVKYNSFQRVDNPQKNG